MAGLWVKSQNESAEKIKRRNALEIIFSAKFFLVFFPPPLPIAKGCHLILYGIIYYSHSQYHNQATVKATWHAMLSLKRCWQAQTFPVTQEQVLGRDAWVVPK